MDIEKCNGCLFLSDVEDIEYCEIDGEFISDKTICTTDYEKAKADLQP